MATLKIQIENGNFVGSNGTYMEVLQPTYIRGNGWECRIQEDGAIDCMSVRDYSDGQHSMRYHINKYGFAKLTLKTPGRPVELLRKGYVISKGRQLSDGLLGLAGGYVDDRYAYFRDEKFQEFLEKYGITAVKCQDPNQEYDLREARHCGGYCDMTLTSDGDIKETRRELKSDVVLERTKKVTGATWVIVEKTQHERDNHNHSKILYSLEKDVTKLHLK